MFRSIENSAFLAILLSLTVLCTHAMASPLAFQQGWESYERGDYAEAATIWEKLARQGNADAQINLAVLYDAGRGLPRDPHRAARWYRAAADQDNAQAQFNLAMLLRDETSLSEHPDESDNWLNRAATKGFAHAQLQLGSDYLQHGERLDHALYWLDQSARNFLDQGETDKADKAMALIRDAKPDHPLPVQVQARTAGPAEIGTPITVTRQIAFGTGWPTAYGLVVTNHHVIADSETISLTTTQGEELPAQLVAWNVENDLALLRVDDPYRLPPAFPLAESGARLGTDVFTIGFPLIDIMGRSPKLSQGIISSLNGLRDDPTSYQISVPIQQGNSGGPLINMRGEVVGVVTSMLGSVHTGSGETYPLPNINYAVKVRALQDLLAQVPGNHDNRQMFPIEQASLEELATRAQDSILIVSAE